jgi:hypothetical protein
MKQQEIQFFWPLTEQIKLDLDYSQCHTHEYYVRAKGIAGTHGPYPTGMQYTTVETVPGDVIIMSANLKIDTKSTVIVTKEKPPLYRRALYKLLGLKWETNDKRN